MLRHSFILIAALLFSSPTWAAGYEKSIPFGGKSAGLAGNATAYMDGSRALFFNPAGLVTRKGHDISADLSLGWATVKGPVNDQNSEESYDSFTTPGGLFYSYASEKWAVGAGYYAAGGSDVKFENVDVSDVVDYRGTANVTSDIRLMEASVGMGFQATDSLRLGLAWRILMADADFAFVQRGTNGPASTLVNAEVNDIHDTQWGGFRLGAQWDATATTHLGLMYRSEVNLDAKATYGGAILSSLGPASTALDQTAAVVKTTLPMAVSLGVKHDLNSDWNLYSEYVWTQYSRVKNVAISGPLTAANGAVTVASNPPDLQFDMKDQHNVRLAAEYLGWDMPFRFGYLWTSQVTSKDWARSTSSPPGQGHTFTMGSTYAFKENFNFDGSLEYTLQDGHGNGATPGQSGPGTDIRAGNHTVDSYVLHMGMNYNF